MKNWTECTLAQHRFPIRVFRFFVCSVCLVVRVNVVDKKKAVVCSLLATLAITLSEKKHKMRSKKRCLKMNISCDAHLLNEMLETDVLWDDAIVSSEGINWENCGIPCVNCAVLCVKDNWKGQFWGLHYCLSKLRSLLSFLSGMTSHSKIAQFNWECIRRFKL
jgi:hypothetical protein